MNRAIGRFVVRPDSGSKKPNLILGILFNNPEFAKILKPGHIYNIMVGPLLGLEEYAENIPDWPIEIKLEDEGKSCLREPGQPDFHRVGAYSWADEASELVENGMYLFTDEELEKLRKEKEDE
jgi:hypothetical protein